MALNWNEIKERATAFSREWAETSNEEADAKPFLVEFFKVFGISSKRVSTFEHRIKKLDDSDGYIDLLWKGMILIEMKSRGKNLDKAYGQATAYMHGLKQHELPKFIMVSDFENIRLYDLETMAENPEGGDFFVEFKLKNLSENVGHFGALLGYQKKIYKEQDPANVKAAEAMGKFHDRLEAIGYTGHPLEAYLVRVLFLMFAEDTGILQKQQLQEYIEQRTNEDGSDLAPKLQEVFQTLNTPPAKRFKNIDEQLAEFPYINGRLFEENLPTASFDGKMRQSLLECCYIDWSRISPAIFGSMFQSVMDPEERRDLGAHYTSETNILKLIKPLFLDELWAEFEKTKNDQAGLSRFHDKIADLRFLDPACGCGNFLIVAYREIRLLELQTILALQRLNKRIHQMDFIDLSLFFKVNVDRFYGIEYEEFPARIAEVAMWLIDHQMNMLASAETGQRLFRIPLTVSATIVHGNALAIDWQSLLNPINSADIVAGHANIYTMEEPEQRYKTVNIQAATFEIHQGKKPEPANAVKFDYILGNPPFVGHHLQDANQKKDLRAVWGEIRGAGVMDYVTAWYLKAGRYMQGAKTKTAFVSTNSIAQGEQVGILWGVLSNQLKLKIHFAHRTFKWSNEAKGVAAVHCIIIGFANFDTDVKTIYAYESTKGESHAIKAKNINAYLVDAKDLLLENRDKPISQVPKMMYGSKPTDGGNFIMTDKEKTSFLAKEPQAEKFVRPFLSAKEYLNGQKRWCLWLVDADPGEMKRCPGIMERIALVKKFRGESVAESTRAYKLHHLFRQVTQPKDDFLLVPRTTSENREYSPIGFFAQENIVSDTCMSVPNATLFHFGVMTSIMHMAWVKHTCGRLENSLRYSKDIVYNNFPWPENPAAKQVKTIEAKAQKVLDARAKFPENSLADLYDPLTMPPALLKAHAELDKAVDLAYRPQTFTGEANRLSFLFELHEKYTADLFTKEKPKKTKKKV